MRRAEVSVRNLNAHRRRVIIQKPNEGKSMKESAKRFPWWLIREEEEAADGGGKINK